MKDRAKSENEFVDNEEWKIRLYDSSPPTEDDCHLTLLDKKAADPADSRMSSTQKSKGQASRTS